MCVCFEVVCKASAISVRMRTYDDDAYEYGSSEKREIYNKCGALEQSEKVIQGVVWLWNYAKDSNQDCTPCDEDCT